MVARIAAANSRVMTDQTFMTGFLRVRDENPLPRAGSREPSRKGVYGDCWRAPLGKHMGAPEGSLTERQAQTNPSSGLPYCIATPRAGAGCPRSLVRPAAG